MLSFLLLHSPSSTGGNSNGDANAKDDADRKFIKLFLAATGVIVAPPKEAEAPFFFLCIFVSGFIGGASSRPNRVRFNPARRRRDADLLAARRAACDREASFGPRRVRR